MKNNPTLIRVDNNCRRWAKFSSFFLALLTSLVVFALIYSIVFLPVILYLIHYHTLNYLCIAYILFWSPTFGNIVLSFKCTYSSGVEYSYNSLMYRKLVHLVRQGKQQLGAGITQHYIDRDFAFLCASERGHMEIITLLLDTPEDKGSGTADLEDSQSRLARFSSERCQKALIGALRNRHGQIAKFLIEDGKVNTHRAFEWAMEKNDVMAIKILVQYDKNSLFNDRFFGTFPAPLEHALSTDLGHVDFMAPIISCLLSAGERPGYDEKKSEYDTRQNSSMVNNGKAVTLRRALRRLGGVYRNPSLTWDTGNVAILSLAKQALPIRYHQVLFDALKKKARVAYFFRECMDSSSMPNVVAKTIWDYVDGDILLTYPNHNDEEYLSLDMKGVPAFHPETV